MNPENFPGNYTRASRPLAVRPSTTPGAPENPPRPDAHAALLRRYSMKQSSLVSLIRQYQTSTNDWQRAWDAGKFEQANQCREHINQVLVPFIAERFGEFQQFENRVLRKVGMAGLNRRHESTARSLELSQEQRRLAAKVADDFRRAIEAAQQHVAMLKQLDAEKRREERQRALAALHASEAALAADPHPIVKLARRVLGFTPRA